MAATDVRTGVTTAQGIPVACDRLPADWIVSSTLSVGSSTSDWDGFDVEWVWSDCDGCMLVPGEGVWFEESVSEGRSDGVAPGDNEGDRLNEGDEVKDGYPDGEIEG